MGKLTSAAADQIAKTQDRQSIPDWFAPLGAVVGAFLALYIGYGLLFGSSEPVGGATVPIAVAAPTLNTGTDNVVNTTAATTTDTVAPGEAPIDATVSISNQNGQTVSVPSGSLDVAQAAAVATLTGDWSQVPSAGAPLIGGTAYPGAAVLAAVLLDNTTNEYRYLITVAPGGNEANRFVTMVARQEGTGWLAVP